MQNWSRSFHGLTYLGKFSDPKWVSVCDYTNFAEVTVHQWGKSKYSDQQALNVIHTAFFFRAPNKEEEATLNSFYGCGDEYVNQAKTYAEKQLIK